MNKLHFLLLILYNVIWAQRRPPLQVSYFQITYQGFKLGTFSQIRKLYLQIGIYKSNLK